MLDTTLLRTPLQALTHKMPANLGRLTDQRATMSPCMSLASYSDEDLVARSREITDAAERETLTNELLRRYFSTVARWCLRFTPDRETAADLAQEVLTKAYFNLSAFEGDSKFSTWLFMIARNHCLNAVRANKRSVMGLRVGSDEDTLHEVADPSQSALDWLEKESDAKAVKELLAKTLDETERTVFALHYGEDLPLDAITRLLSLSNASGAKAYIVSARRKLARFVQRKQAGMQEGRR